ncbi:MAG: F0F1 ATP synthase subunit gamma [Candidatus Korobacteraceae bacterium]
MPNVLDIRRRIRSVRNTRQITKAMKMISAARLRRAQERALAARPYAQMLTNVLKSLVSRTETHDGDNDQPRHPLLARRAEKTALLVVVTGDRGLAGAFNANILKAAMRFIESRPDINIDIEAVGRKGRDFLRRRFPIERLSAAEADADIPQTAPERSARVRIVGEHVNILTKLEFAYVSRLVESIVQRYQQGEVDSVYVLHNEFKSVIAQRLVIDEVLPIEQIGEQDLHLTEELTSEQKKRAIEAAAGTGVKVRAADTSEIDQQAAQFATAPVDYIYEQPPDELFRSLLPKYVTLHIFGALLESIAAEHAARMTAMDAATNNASDMIDALTLTMNRARQAAITKEIIEIVSGAAAL